MYAIQKVTHILQAWNSFVSRRNIETLLSSISDLDDILVAINYKINQKLFDNLGHYPIFPEKSVKCLCEDHPVSNTVFSTIISGHMH